MYCRFTKNKDKSDTWVYTFIGVFLIMLAGYITNFVLMIDYILSNAELMSITIFQAIIILGVFIPQLGGIVGIISWFL